MEASDLSDENFRTIRQPNQVFRYKTEFMTDSQTFERERTDVKRNDAGWTEVIPTAGVCPQ